MSNQHSSVLLEPPTVSELGLKFHVSQEFCLLLYLKDLLLSIFKATRCVGSMGFALNVDAKTPRTDTFFN